MPEIPWDDPRCIFCLEEKPLTRAHLIPECVGGNLFARNECGDCNSDLGSRVEAAIRKSPQIRGAAIALRDQLPELEARINDGQRFIAKTADGTVVPFVRRDGGYRMLNRSEPGNRILDDDSAMKSIHAQLLRAGRGCAEADAFIDELLNAPLGTIMQVDEDTAARRGAIRHDDVRYGWDGELFDDMAAALIAYRFYAAIYPEVVLASGFDPLRAWFRGEADKPDACAIFAGRLDYMPIHGLSIRPTDEGYAKFRVCLLGWLTYEITLLGAPAWHTVAYELDLATGDARGAYERTADSPATEAS